MLRKTDGDSSMVDCPLLSWKAGCSTHGCSTHRHWVNHHRGPWAGVSTSTASAEMNLKKKQLQVDIAKWFFKWTIVKWFFIGGVTSVQSLTVGHLNSSRVLPKYFWNTKTSCINCRAYLTTTHLILQHYIGWALDNSAVTQKCILATILKAMMQF